MKKFMHMEDNEDGTTTLTTNMFGEEEQTFVIPLGFDSFGALFPGLTDEVAVDLVAKNLIPVPNNVDE